MQKLFLKDFLQKLKSNYIKFKKKTQKKHYKNSSQSFLYFLAKNQKVRGAKKNIKKLKNTKNLSILN